MPKEKKPSDGEKTPLSLPAAAASSSRLTQPSSSAESGDVAAKRAEIDIDAQKLVNMLNELAESPQIRGYETLRYGAQWFVRLETVCNDASRLARYLSSRCQHNSYYIFASVDDKHCDLGVNTGHLGFILEILKSERERITPANNADRLVQLLRRRYERLLTSTAITLYTQKDCSQKMCLSIGVKIDSDRDEKIITQIIAQQLRLPVEYSTNGRSTCTIKIGVVNRQIDQIIEDLERSAPYRPAGNSPDELRKARQVDTIKWLADLLRLHIKDFPDFTCRIEEGNIWLRPRYLEDFDKLVMILGRFRPETPNAYFSDKERICVSEENHVATILGFINLLRQPITVQKQHLEDDKGKAPIDQGAAAAASSSASSAPTTLENGDDIAKINTINRLVELIRLYDEHFPYFTCLAMEWSILLYVPNLDNIENLEKILERFDSPGNICCINDSQKSATFIRKDRIDVFIQLLVEMLEQQVRLQPIVEHLLTPTVSNEISSSSSTTVALPPQANTAAAELPSELASLFTSFFGSFRRTNPANTSSETHESTSEKRS